LLPDGNEWTVIEELLELLKLLHRAMYYHYECIILPNIEYASPPIYKLMVLVLKITETDSQTVKQFKQAILAYLKYCYSMPDIKTLLDIVAFLDPLFKELDPFVAVTDRVDIEESVKFEMLVLVENGS